MERPDTDSDNARRLQTEEVLASLSSRSRTPQQQPSVQTSAPATAAENGRNSSAPKGGSKNARRRNSGGKGKAHEAAAAGVRGGYRNPNAKVGNFRNEYVYVPKKPSPSVVSSAKSVGEQRQRLAAGRQAVETANLEPERPGQGPEYRGRADSRTALRDRPRASRHLRAARRWLPLHGRAAVASRRPLAAVGRSAA